MAVVLLFYILKRQILYRHTAMIFSTYYKTFFPHTRVQKATWISPDGMTENQIDHLIVSQRWRISLQDVHVKRGGTIWSDHRLVVVSLKIKLAARKWLMSQEGNLMS